MGRIASRIREEFHELLPPTVFFLVALHLVALIRVLMLKGTGITVATSATVTITALILAKAVLIADMLPFINLYPHKPLYYNVAWKSSVYMLAAMFLHYLERLYDFWRETGGFLAANEKMLAEIVWPHFWAIQILLVLLVLMYCTTRELVRVIGRDKVREILMHPPQGATAGE